MRSLTGESPGSLLRSTQTGKQTMRSNRRGFRSRIPVDSNSVTPAQEPARHRRVNRRLARRGARVNHRSCPPGFARAAPGGGEHRSTLIGAGAETPSVLICGSIRGSPRRGRQESSSFAVASMFIRRSDSATLPLARITSVFCASRARSATSTSTPMKRL